MTHIQTPTIAPWVKPVTFSGVQQIVRTTDRLRLEHRGTDRRWTVMDLDRRIFASCLDLREAKIVAETLIAAGVQHFPTKKPVRGASWYPSAKQGFDLRVLAVMPVWMAALRTKTEQGYALQVYTPAYAPDVDHDPETWHVYQVTAQIGVQVNMRADGWDIVALTSGLLITTHTNRSQTLQAAAALAASPIDWSINYAQLLTTDPLRIAARNALRQVRRNIFREGDA